MQFDHPRYISTQDHYAPSLWHFVLSDAAVQLYSHHFTTLICESYYLPPLCSRSLNRILDQKQAFLEFRRGLSSNALREKNRRIDLSHQKTRFSSTEPQFQRPKKSKTWWVGSELIGKVKQERLSKKYGESSLTHRHVMVMCCGNQTFWWRVMACLVSFSAVEN